jgi:hypothetical protein
MSSDFQIFVKFLAKLSLMCSIVIGMWTLGASTAFAMPESCNDFQKVSAPRNSIMAQLNAFKKKKPTAAQACSLLSRLVSTEQKIMTWMIANKDWCQIPEEQITGLKQASGQSVTVRGQACNAASQQAKQIAQMRRQQQMQQRQQQSGGGGQAPGAGVKLPQGAL